MFALAAGAVVPGVRASVHWQALEGFVKIDLLPFQKDSVTKLNSTVALQTAIRRTVDDFY